VSGFLTAILWRVDPDRETMEYVDSWTAAEPDLLRFTELTRQRQIIEGRGFAGRVWSTREPLWTPDLHADQSYPRARHAVEAGLRMAVAVPVIARGELVGVMDFFARDVRESAPEHLALLKMLGSQVAQFMDRQAQQAQIARLDRIYRVLSGINAAIVHAQDRNHLFRMACHIAVEQGNFGIAWIGRFDPVTMDVTPAAWAGFSADEFVIVGSKASARNDIPKGQGALGQAVREKKPVYCNDITLQTGVGGKRREEAIRRGYRSLMVLPLLEDDEVSATLALFAREPDFFNEQEVRLLSQLANNVSFALKYMAKKDRLGRMVNRDSLTGLPNREVFTDLLERALAQARRRADVVAVAVVDLDNFKLINDGLGHAAGDEFLRTAAARIVACVREGDTVARLGADQFALILSVRATAAPFHVRSESSAVHGDSQLIAVLQGILQAVVEPVLFSEQELQLTCSIGVSLYPRDGDDADKLLRNAGAALSYAKELGRNKFHFYTAEINAEVTDRLSLHLALRRAADHGEFVLYYQPLIDLSSGRLSGVEALMRWNKSESEVVLPGDFVPVLEETGLIIDTGRWALETAMHDYNQWREWHDCPPPVAVNVSQLQLAQVQFADLLRTIIKENRSSAEAGLEIEITETLLMEDIEGTLPKLHEVRSMGIGISVDDFGTGYSSLSYLARLPVNKLKIDRTFIRDMETSPEGLTIVTTIISLAHSLGLKVVAEGVETKRQIATLRMFKCDEIQGYAVSPPLPKSEFEKWWARYIPPTTSSES